MVYKSRKSCTFVAQLAIRLAEKSLDARESGVSPEQYLLL